MPKLQEIKFGLYSYRNYLSNLNHVSTPHLQKSHIENRLMKTLIKSRNQFNSYPISIELLFLIQSLI